MKRMRTALMIYLNLRSSYLLTQLSKQLSYNVRINVVFS